VSLTDRKAKLLTYSAKQVRQNTTLFAEFVFLYTEEVDDPREKLRREKSCKGCNFKSVFARWQREQRMINIKKIETMPKNTFKLVNPNNYIYIPAGKFAGEVITNNSPDEMVVEYLKQVKGADRENRIKKNFAELPEAMRKKAAPKAEPKAEVKAAPKVVAKPKKAVKKPVKKVNGDTAKK